MPALGLCCSYTGFVEAAGPSKVGVVPFQSVLTEAEASHRTIAALLQSNSSSAKPSAQHIDQGTKHSGAQDSGGLLRENDTVEEAAPTTDARETNAETMNPEASELQPLQVLVSLHKPNGDFAKNLWIGSEDKLSENSTITDVRLA
eukprot:SAG31_NODE_14909_length_781_cov_1.193548_2_plen_146_part_00